VIGPATAFCRPFLPQVFDKAAFLAGDFDAQLELEDYRCSFTGYQEQTSNRIAGPDGLGRHLGFPYLFPRRHYASQWH
jgi:hypothetical protein